jgi:hypothetical protein
MTEPLDPAIRDCLASIADALFPLETWSNEADKHIPPEHQAKPLPWRGERDTLSIESLKSVRCFERSLAEEHDDDALIDRFTTLVRDPLEFCPIAEMKAWRKLRGLPEADVRFAADLGENIEHTIVDRSGRRWPVSHRGFFQRCWVQLKNVCELRQPVGSVEWGHLVKDLLDDKDKSVTGWDAGQLGVKSSEFIRAFVHEMLLTLLDGKHELGRSDERWNFALPIELGEYRRPGNRYAVGDTRNSVQQFRAKLAEAARRAAER